MLGQGMSGFGGKGKKRTSLSERLEISQSRARIATLIGQYEEIEMEGEELSLSLSLTPTLTQTQARTRTRTRNLTSP